MDPETKPKDELTEEQQEEVVGGHKPVTPPTP